MKISELPTLDTKDLTDYLPVVDLSETDTQSQNKRILVVLLSTLDGSDWWVGSGTPATNLGRVDDGYIDLDTSSIYSKGTDGTWTLVGTLPLTDSTSVLSVCGELPDTDGNVEVGYEDISGLQTALTAISDSLQTLKDDLASVDGSGMIGLDCGVEYGDTTLGYGVSLYYCSYSTPITDLAVVQAPDGPAGSVLTWSTRGAAEYYEIYVSTDATTFTYLDQTEDNTYWHQGLDEVTTYTYYVLPISTQATMVASNQASITTPARIYTTASVRASLRSKISNWWMLDQNLTDTGLAGNSYTGTATYTEMSDYHYCLSPTTEQLDTSSTLGATGSNLCHTSMGWAFGMKVALSNLTQSFSVFVGGSSGYHESVWFNYSAGKIVFFGRPVGTSNTGWWTITSTSTFVAGYHHHVYGTYDYTTNTVGLYIDGVLEASTVLTTGRNRTVTLFGLGNETYGGTPTTGAWISDLWWAHDSLTNDEIQYLYNNNWKRYLSDFYSEPYSDYTSMDGVVTSISDVYYLLNEGSGTLIADSISGSVGALTGGTWSTSGDLPGALSSESYLTFNGSSDYATTLGTDLSTTRTFGYGGLLRCSGTDGYDYIWQMRVADAQEYPHMGVRIANAGTQYLIDSWNSSGTQVGGSALSMNPASTTYSQVWTFVAGFIDPVNLYGFSACNGVAQSRWFGASSTPITATPSYGELARGYNNLDSTRSFWAGSMSRMFHFQTQPKMSDFKKAYDLMLEGDTRPKVELSISTDAGSITLTWTSLETAVNYGVYRCIGGGCTVMTLIETTTDLTYIENNLEPYQTYRYYILPTLEDGEAAISNIVDLEAPFSGVVQFSIAEYDVAGDTATLRVTRTEDTFGTVSVDYAFVDGTATLGNEYAGIAGTLTWADGDAEDQFIEFQIFASEDWPKTLTVVLSNYQGDGYLGDNATALVRINEEWTPASMQLAKPVIWYNGDESFTYSGTEILSWADVAGSGYTATGTTGTAPTYEADALNGHDVLVFNGTDQFLKITGAAALWNSLNQFWGYMLYSVDVATDGYPLVSFASANSAGAARITLTPFHIGVRTSDTGSIYTGDFNAVADTWTISGVNVSTNSRTIEAYQDGIQVDYVTGTFSGTGSGSSTSALDYSRIGASNSATPASVNYFPGKLAETVFGKSKPNLYDPRRVEGYLAHKYGLTGNFADDHLYKDNQPWKDPYWASVVSFSSLDMRVGTTTFADEVVGTLTTVGSPTSTLVDGPYGDFGTAYTCSASSYVTIPTSTNWVPDVAFTIEIFANITSFSDNSTLVSRRETDTGGATGWNLSVSSSGLVSFIHYSPAGTTAINLLSTTAVTLDTWCHVAATRDASGNWYLFLNGHLEASGTETGVNADNGTAIRIGWQNSSFTSRYMKGYLKGLRITRGVCRYTSDFMVPLGYYPKGS